MLRRLPLLLLISLLFGTSLAWTPARAAEPVPAANPAFTKVWERTDQLVRAHDVARTWFWGEAPFARVVESFAGSPDGQRLVEYYDKSRMEITNPGGSPTSPWYVTNGLLVKELMSGQMQVGPDPGQAEVYPPSTVPVVGDLVPGQPAPTYAILGRFATLGGPVNRAPNKVGQQATATLSEDGTVGSNTRLGAGSALRLGTYVPETGHNIPDVFWNFMHAKGPILSGKFLNSGPLIDWVYALGYPITEPYWVKAKVGGKTLDVLVQAFERRVLSYTPSNPAGWQVEMGNVGRHYYDWRYKGEHPGSLSAPIVATRIVVPKAKVDSKIIPVYVESGSWEVADYAVGWLYGTAQPGQVGNSVCAGHNTYRGEESRYLENLKAGDTFTIYTSDNVAHNYAISEIQSLPEKNMSEQLRLANARYMDPTPDERVTLISCWPYVQYTHRIIVIGKPVR
jgi:LPXTG-site transpeptidase (sortase) family protein